MEIIDALKERLSKDLPGEDSHTRLTPKFRPEGSPSKSTVKAAVLILIYPDLNCTYRIVFMKRQKYNGVHSAQISFPGGKHEKYDRNLMETALRECHEETGVDSSTVKILGQLTELYIPISDYLVYPFIGITDQPPKFVIDPKEVDYLIELPLIKLPYLSIKETTIGFKGKNYSIPYFDIENEIVWGATSMILSEFIDILHDINLDKLL